MDESELVELVRRAVSLHDTTGCLEFVNDKLQARLRSDLSLQPLGTVKELRAVLVRHVLAGGVIDCRKEAREEYQDREFWFRVLVPLAGYIDPLFFELELTDDDRDCPTALILNVHFSPP